ncbi:regulator of chromosome condensation 1/beta-lactamase-inhibitor protein II [Entophlyctis helioformis]|nr:regulator of chromosome condensation 1/beta-lactamase-inhibitor protein II [Entophlyctis helioformis]
MHAICALCPVPHLSLPNTEVGDVFVVGSGDCGQLGLGQEVLEKERPALLHYFKEKQIVGVNAGGLHNLALSLDGKLYSWGCNDQKALGRDGEETEPGPVEGLDKEFIVTAACGDSISAALTREGRVYAWGTFRDKTGIFGFAPGIKIQDRPHLIPELKSVVQIAAGTNHLVAVGRDGKIYTWGVGEQGQLGRKVISRHLVEASLTPRPVNFRPPHRLSSRFTHVYCGGYHTFMVHETQALFSFGLNNYGQLGLGDAEDHDNPEQVEGLEPADGIALVSGGEHHTVVLDQKGNVHTFGRGDSGQLGFPSTERLEEAKHLPSLTNTVSVSANGAFSLAVCKDKESGINKLYGWGYGEMNQLANGGEDSPEPSEFTLKGRHVIAAAAGGQHTLFLLRPKAE